MNNTITVTALGKFLILSKECADHFGLKQGDVINDEPFFWEVLEMDSGMRINLLKAKIELEKNHG